MQPFAVAACESIGTCESAIAPRIGRAPFATFLKKLRRDCSSSFLSCFMTLDKSYRLSGIGRYGLINRSVSACICCRSAFRSPGIAHRNKNGQRRSLTQNMQLSLTCNAHALPSGRRYIYLPRHLPLSHPWLRLKFYRFQKAKNER